MFLSGESMGIVNIDTITRILFNVESAVLIEVLTVFVARFVFYALIIYFIIFLLHLVAKALNRSIRLRQGFCGFLRRYWDSVLIQSLLISLFLISIPYNALFEFLVFVVMWLQLEIMFVSWRIEAGPHFIFDVSECEDLKPGTEECVATGNIYVHVKNIGKIPVHNMGLTRVLNRQMIPIKPEVWSKHLEHPITNLAPGEVKYIIGIDQNVLHNYLNVIFEICYSTPLRPYPLEECTHITLTRIDSRIEVYPLDPPIALDTPLVKLYKMWRDALTLPLFATTLKRFPKT
jgi:hypothetical protein